jgi:hypothetical protein
MIQSEGCWVRMVDYVLPPRRKWNSPRSPHRKCRLRRNSTTRTTGRSISGINVHPPTHFHCGNLSSSCGSRTHALNRYSSGKPFETADENNRSYLQLHFITATESSPKLIHQSTTSSYTNFHSL